MTKEDLYEYIRIKIKCAREPGLFSEDIYDMINQIFGAVSFYLFSTEIKDEKRYQKEEQEVLNAMCIADTYLKSLYLKRERELEEEGFYYE
jgi:hypothetical protein